jgi:uncharacterized RDD family membrane protein YckC
LDATIVFGLLIYASKLWGTTLPNGLRGWEGPNAALVLLLIGGYWILPEWLFGATIGKWMLRIRVSPVSTENLVSCSH